MDKNKAVEKIKKLLELADTRRNTNLEEATAAAAKAQALMEKYRIERALLDKDAPSRIHWKHLQDKGRPENWKNFLVSILARHNGCFIVRSQNYESDGQIHIVGETQDIDVIQNIYTYIVFELNKLCIKELLIYKTKFGFYPSKNYSKSFYLGGISVIDETLEKAKKQAREEEIKKVSSMKDKIKIHNALSIIDNKSDKAKEWVQNNFVGAEIKDVTPNNPDHNGYIAGKQAAKNLNLNTAPQLKEDKK